MSAGHRPAPVFPRSSMLRPETAAAPAAPVRVGTHPQWH
jgi:hypothetical protein